MQPDVLVIDELVYLPCTPDGVSALYHYHVVNERHLKHRPSTIASDSIDRDVLVDHDLGAVIVDRLLEREHNFKLDGPHSEASTTPSTTPTTRLRRSQSLSKKPRGFPRATDARPPLPRQTVSGHE
jgi:hypothetical protein